MTLNHDQKNLSKIIPSVDSTYQSIREILEKARSAVYRSINFAMVLAYWNIGKVIVEEEQQGKERAEYGIRQFYIIFPNCDSLRRELTWTHYRRECKRVIHKRSRCSEARGYYKRSLCS
ncbi:Uncharacterised protein [uncultured archaeon]|nr:Uncharacterised protein [uncultured archaeon]